MKKLSRESIIDAYNLAISYLQTEQCAYDNNGDYEKGRLWLADKLNKEIDNMIKKGEI